MPRINLVGPTNSPELRDAYLPATPEEEPSAGISSLTSESKPDKNGSFPQGTESSLQSPAQDAENPSGLDQPPSPAPSSSASSTDGSTQETGSSQVLQPDSSAESVPATPATPDQPDPARAQDLINEAREAYIAQDYAGAERLLQEAEAVDPSLVGSAETAVAHKAIADAQAATTTTE